MIGFDFDGVLAEGPSQDLFTKPWRFMNGNERKARAEALVAHYGQAAPLYRPRGSEQFIVVTARKDVPDVRAVSQGWLDRHHFGRCHGLFMLGESRTIKNVIAFKTSIINNYACREFSEDNPAVVKGLRKACPKTRIWLFNPKTGEFSI